MIVGEPAEPCYYSEMVLQIELTQETEARLRVQAAAAGKDVFTYASELVARATAQPDLDAVLSPLRKQFESSGISQDQLIKDITDAQSEYRSEHHKKTA